jgi:hypothetical protein
VPIPKNTKEPKQKQYDKKKKHKISNGARTLKPEKKNIDKSL